MKALTALVAILMLFGTVGRVQGTTASGGTQGTPTSTGGTTSPQPATSPNGLQACLAQEAADQAAHEQVRQSVMQLSAEKTRDDQTIEQEMQPYYAQAKRDDQAIRDDRARVQADEAAVARDQHDINAVRGHADAQSLEQQLTALRTQADQDAQTLAQDQSRVQTDEATVQRDEETMKQLEQQRATTSRPYDMQARSVPTQTSPGAGQNAAALQQRAQRENDDRAYAQQLQTLRAQYERDSQTLQQDRARAGADDSKVRRDQQAIDTLSRQIDYERRADDRMPQLQARLATDTNTLVRDRAGFRADYADMEQAMQTLEQFRQQRTADDQAIQQQLQALQPQYVATWQALQRIQASCARLKGTSSK